MRAVDVRSRHQDDLVVARLGCIERAVTLMIADASAQSGDQAANFIIVEHFIEAGFLNVEQFTTNRQDRLRRTVAPLLSGSTCGVTLHNIELGDGWILRGAVGKFTRQAAGGECPFANGFAEGAHA